MTRPFVLALLGCTVLSMEGGATCVPKPPTVITGVLCGRALLTNGQFANATISLVDASGTVAAKMQMDAKGWFALPPVPAAAYTVRGIDGNGHPLPLNVTVDMRDANARTCTAPVTIHFGSQECDGTIESSTPH